MLTDVNTITMKATCKKCGRVDIILRGQWTVCYNARRDQDRNPHGLTLTGAANYVALVGACELCDSELGLGVDHNHETKQVRGILCRNCNMALGLLEEDPVRMKNMIEYLEYWNSKEG